MQTLDLGIIFGYLIGITLLGISYSGKQETTTDYFVCDWLVGGITKFS